MSGAPAYEKIRYTSKVLEHFRNPRNMGRLEDADVSAKVGSPACGDLIKIYLKVDDSKRINDISFDSVGCAANIASSSVMTEMVKGKMLNEAKVIKPEDIAAELGGLPAFKMHCSVLAKTSLDSAILKWEVKRGLRQLDEAFARAILSGVLDPVSGEDIISSGMVRGLNVDGRKITVYLNVEEGSEMAKSLEDDTVEAFEGLNLDLHFIFRKAS